MHLFKHSLYVMLLQTRGEDKNKFFDFVLNLTGMLLHSDNNGPRRDKTCLRAFRQSEIQTSLLSYRD